MKTTLVKYLKIGDLFQMAGYPRFHILIASEKYGEKRKIKFVNYFLTETVIYHNTLEVIIYAFS